MTHVARQSCSLDILFSCTRAKLEGGDETAIYHPGDTVAGFVKLVGHANTVLDGISLTLEGTVRIWESSLAGEGEISAVQHRFLKEVQPVAYSNTRRLEIAAGEICMIPFNFKLPQYIPLPDALAEPLLRLPPSLGVGEAVVDSWGRPCMQPLIEYAVRSLVTMPALGGPHRAQLQQSRKFVLIPFSELGPPLEQADFPGEFKPNAMAVLRKLPFVSKIGELSVAMDEPEPLKVLGDGCRSCGNAWIKLTFWPSRTTRSQTCQHPWECTLESQVRVKTFYSTMPLGEMASDRLLRVNRHLRVRSEFIGLEPRRANLCLSAFTKEPSDVDLTSSGLSPYSSKLLLPIDLADDLVPTFCSLLAARRYALRVSLKIKGLSHQPMVVEAPLQVCYCNVKENQTHEYREFESASCSTAPPKSTRTSISGDGGTSEILPSYGF